MDITNSPAVLLYSGGPDSTTLLYDLLSQGRKVYVLTYNFGEQEAENEKSHGESILSLMKGDVEPHHFDFSESLRRFYGLPKPQFLRKAVVVGKSPIDSNYVQPFGSTVALMLTASWALKHDVREIFYAVHQNDSMFYDNRREYFSLLSQVTAECEGEDYRISFCTPYLGMSKSDVIQKGASLGVPFGMTWSCARGGDVHCGLCDPCKDRQMSFSVAGIEDPVEYEETEVAIPALSGSAR
ncbi:7-cyano-7-deazaguanine synthase [Actinomyces faecalis]|uniref:7-cyano-7-deazaguanine synthase n=1 Tax=Actinomyces faecalis TaxID=2722820 RepID=UPI001555607E|nr:7-cyano-7-deazaguanine synthase [Actinomyces faecalis]